MHEIYTLLNLSGDIKFFPIIVLFNKKEFAFNSINFKDWLISNKAKIIYLNSVKYKKLIYTQNSSKYGIYLFLNNINGKYSIDLAKDLKNRLWSYYNSKDLQRK